MEIRYNKLWRLMKSDKMNKTKLAKATEISEHTMMKLNEDKPVSLKIKIM